MDMLEIRMLFLTACLAAVRKVLLGSCCGSQVGVGESLSKACEMDCFISLLVWLQRELSWWKVAVDSRQRLAKGDGGVEQQRVMRTACERDRNGCLVEQTWDEEAQGMGSAKVAVWDLGVGRLRW